MYRLAAVVQYCVSKPYFLEGEKVERQKGNNEIHETRSASKNHYWQLWTLRVNNIFGGQANGASSLKDQCN